MAEDPPPQKPPAPPANAEREKRLAEALRANLRRRKGEKPKDS
jgi:hypothetical protein